MMKTNTKLFTILFPALIGCMVSSIAAANVIFSDSTFNLSDYSITKYQTNGIDVTATQTSSGNPGPALQIEIHVPRTFESVIFASQYIINTNFRYDPGVQGSITSIDMSGDFRGMLIQNGVSIPFNPIGGSNGGGSILIRQGEYFYTNLIGIAGPPVVGNNNFGSTHADGLKASDFGLLTDAANFRIDDTQHPSFTNGVLEFGVPLGIYGTNLFGFPEMTAVASIDNLRFTISNVSEPEPVTVPEPETYAMLLAGLGIIVFMARQKKT